jgi:hypothetical protein
MPEISDDEFKELQTLRSSSVGKDLEIARATFRADNPHVPVGLLNAYSGDPAGMEGFGKALLEQFPKPQATQQPTPPPAAPVVPPPAAQVTLPPAPPAPATPPVLAAQMQAQMSPEAQRLAYEQQAANGGALAIPGTVPAPAPVPSPGSAASLSPQNAQKAESEKIRDLMRIGRATPEQVQWLSQWGEHGFTAAMTDHARKVAAVVGRR